MRIFIPYDSGNVVLLTPWSSVSGEQDAEIVDKSICFDLPIGSRFQIMAEEFDNIYELINNMEVKSSLAL